jgi:hypothetical protein
MDCLTATLSEDVFHGIMSSKKARNSPGQCLVKGEKPRLGTQTAVAYPGFFSWGVVQQI